MVMGLLLEDLCLVAIVLLLVDLLQVAIVLLLVDLLQVATALHLVDLHPVAIVLHLHLLHLIVTVLHPLSQVMGVHHSQAMEEVSLRHNLKGNFQLLLKYSMGDLVQ